MSSEQSTLRSYFRGCCREEDGAVCPSEIAHPRETLAGSEIRQPLIFEKVSGVVAVRDINVIT